MTRPGHLLIWIVLTAATVCLAGRAPIPAKSADPYLGAIVMEAETGDVLFEDNADAQGYPASVIKLMTLLQVLEEIETGQASLDEHVTVTAESARMGGSQVYLAEHEVFTVEDLLYAMIIQSANDAATALAIHLADSKEAFAEAMNRRAKELGMSATEIHSVHGLPPGAGQKPDITTARDVALLCRELLKHEDVLDYTSTQVRGFRDGEFVMRTHNRLIQTMPGCDGFKTGYFSKAGYSIAATVERHGNRLIAVVLDSRNRKTRDRVTRRLIEDGFRELARRRRARFAEPATRR